MKDRVSLQIIEGKLVLSSLIECKKLRIPRQFMEFIIDTGSPDSYISEKDAKKLQIPIKNRDTKGKVDFGGSRFNQITLPKMDMYLLKQEDYIKLSISSLKNH